MNETMLQPSKEPLETTSEPTQNIDNAPKYIICVI